MIELWLAMRDCIGLNAKVNYDGESILIKDLPAQAYDVFRGEKRIVSKISPNILPGFLLDYLTEREKQGEIFGDVRFPADIVSRLDLRLIQAQA